jgi:GT2 family glycosyltransferase
VSIVIPTHQGRDSVLRLLRALDTQTVAPTDFEVIVAVDGSTDQTEEAVDAHAARFRLRQLWQPQGGVGAARNAGATLADGEIILFLDDDMDPAADLVATHVARHDADAALGVVGAVPVVVAVDAPPVVRYRAAGFARKMERLASRSERLEFNDVYTGNFSIRRNAFLAAGGYDEAFALYGHEDYDLSRRLSRAGLRFVFEAAAVAHQHYAKSVRELAADVEAEGATAVLLALKHPDAMSSLELGRYGRRSGAVRRRIAGLVLLSRAFERFPSRLIAAVERAERSIPSPASGSLFARYDMLFMALYWIGAERALHACGAPWYQLAVRDAERWLRAAREDQHTLDNSLS